MTRLAHVPLDLDEANAFVSRVHRHHGRVAGPRPRWHMKAASLAITLATLLK